MADKNEQSTSDAEESEPKTSIFDLFEPPPERDSASFGKIPVIKDDEIDLTDSGKSAEVKAAADAEAAGLQHWTAPPTGQVPAVLTSDKEESGLWADVKGPSWHGDDPSWSGPDLADVFADTESVNLDASMDEYEDEDDEEEESYESIAVQRPSRPISSPKATNGSGDSPADRAMPAARASQTPAPPAPTPAPQSRPAPAPAPEPVGSVFDDETDIGPPPERPRQTPAPRPQPQTRPPVAQPAARKAAPPQMRAPQPTPQARPSSAEHPPPLRGGRDDAAESRGLLDDSRNAPAERTLSGALADAQRERLAPRVPVREQIEPNIDDIEFADDDFLEEEEAEDDFGFGPVGGRNIPQAIGVGLVLAGVVLAAMWFGPYTTLLLVAVLALLAVLELYNAMRMAGLRPATLLGIVGTVAAPAAAYYRGDAAFPLIVALAVVFGTLWYLVGADTERPVLNLSLTMMGIFWVGGLAAFGALMLRQDGGIELLLATIIITVASDTMAYIGGRAYGSRPFHHASPNKTWEGTITGFIGALFAGFAIGVTEMGTIWDTNLVPAIVLGAVVGCLAPMGDLAESVVKRDLGVKDMGSLLPGHGGVLDRVDGLLFALPGAYYLALVYGLI